jgi:hypothetical protein
MGKIRRYFIAGMTLFILGMVVSTLDDSSHKDIPINTPKTSPSNAGIPVKPKDPFLKKHAGLAHHLIDNLTDYQLTLQQNVFELMEVSYDFFPASNTNSIQRLKESTYYTVKETELLARPMPFVGKWVQVKGTIERLEKVNLTSGDDVYVWHGSSSFGGVPFQVLAFGKPVTSDPTGVWKLWGTPIGSFVPEGGTHTLFLIGSYMEPVAP